MNTFIYVVGVFTIWFLMWIAYEMYQIRKNLEASNAESRRTVTRQRLSPHLFDQEQP